MPVISPWLIYLCTICSALNWLAVLLFILVFLSIIVAFDDDCKGLSKNQFIICVVIATICLLIMIFVPTKEQMIAIITTMTITPDNLPTDMQTYVKSIFDACGVSK